jgi:hypothetical protein
MKEGRKASASLFQSRGMTLVLGGDYVEMSEIPPCLEES